MATDDSILIQNTPTIPGLRFRHFHGEDDIQGIVEVLSACAEEDQTERAYSVAEMTINIQNLVNGNPKEDLLITEVDNVVIGYSRCTWYVENSGAYLYMFLGNIHPTWRRKGIGTVVLSWLEGRLRKISENHPQGSSKYFQAFARGEPSVIALLEKNGYLPVRYYHEMVCPSLKDIRDFPLPQGLEVRPVQPVHYHKVWDAGNEAFRDNWGFGSPLEKDYEAWLNDRTHFQPHLWQVAWDIEKDQIAGQVCTFIDVVQNEKYQRKRGYTEDISVQRTWRKRGLARALISLSLHAQKEEGMTESALIVDTQNMSGAMRVYEDCGFQVV